MKKIITKYWPLAVVAGAMLLTRKSTNGVGRAWSASPLRFDSDTQYIVTLYRNKRDWKNDIIVDEAQTTLYSKDDLVRFAKMLARGRDYGIIEVYDARYAGRPHAVYHYDRAGRRIDPYAQ